MTWHRQNGIFPSLGMLRRYLKLCYFYAEPRGLLTQSAEEAAQNGLPFEPKHMPRKFPPVEQLVWDYGYQDQRPVWDSPERVVPQHDH